MPAWATAIVLFLVPSLWSAETLVAPRITPAGGTFDSAELVQIQNLNSSGAIFYTTDGNDPRTLLGFVAQSAKNYSDPLSVNESVHVRARVKSGTNWSDVVSAAFSLEHDFSKLIFTEVMFHAMDKAEQTEHEFLELKNSGEQTFDLNGFSILEFSGLKIFERYTFTNSQRLPPDAFFVIGGSQVPGAIVASLDLNNEGAELALVNKRGAVVAKLTYQTHSPWQVVPDNHGYFESPSLVGFSLVRRTNTAAEDPTHFSTWRASAYRGGSPGSDDPESTVLPIYINEVLTRSASGIPDTVELFNPNPVDVNLGGWWLSDERNWPFHYKIPTGTVIRALGYFLLTEDQFSAGTNGFSLSAEGDRCYLFSGDVNGVLTGFSHGVTLGASERDVSFGRETSGGLESFAAQSIMTFGRVNAGPRTSPVVISEVHYHPEGDEGEFIELQNLTSSPVALFDGGNVSAPWALGREGVTTFVFPPNIFIPASGLLVLAHGESSAFRARHGVPAGVQIFPLPFRLSNGGERIELLKSSGQSDGATRYVVVDEMEYDDKSPWPVASDGGGVSLERANPTGFGGNPANWRANPGGISPGRDTNTNHPPRVWAGMDVVAFLDSPLRLTASISDDGWQGRRAIAQWSLSDAVLSSPSGEEATVTFTAPGNYLAEVTVSDAEFTVKDSISITVQPRPFNSWREMHFSAEELKDLEVSGPWNDPDRDGLPTFQEYFFGTDPKSFNSTSPFTIELHQGRLRITWTQLAVVPDAAVKPEMAFRINDIWFDAPELFEIGESVLPEGKIKKVTVTSVDDFTDSRSKFVRIAISPR